MDPKHVSLIKKAIRMIDYMRADLVGILGEALPSPTAKPSPLYEAFDQVRAAKLADPVTNAEGEHVPDCPCWGCISRRYAAELGQVKLTPVEVDQVQRGGLNPFVPFRDKALPNPEPAPYQAELDTIFDNYFNQPVPDGYDGSDYDPSDSVIFMNPPADVPATDPTGPDPDFQPDPAPPPAPEISEYERLKRELHTSHGTAHGGQVCVKKFAPAGVSCTCPKCRT